MTTTMKGLLKGLRYISQIFENEEEEEFQIGLPTDVKHVAHIGCDGPAASTPSWMDEFKAAPTGSAGGETKDGPTELTTQDSVRSNSSFASCPSPGRDRDMPYMPKAARSRRSTGSESSGTKTKSERSERSEKRHARRASKGSESGRDLLVDSPQGNESPMRYPAPDVPKKNRRKKSKESGAADPSSRPSRSSKSQPSASNEPPLGDGPDRLGPQGSNMDAFEDMGDKRISITS